MARRRGGGEVTPEFEDAERRQAQDELLKTVASRAPWVLERLRDEVLPTFRDSLTGFWKLPRPDAVPGVSSVPRAVLRAASRPEAFPERANQVTNLIRLLVTKRWEDAGYWLGELRLKRLGNNVRETLARRDPRAAEQLWLSVDRAGADEARRLDSAVAPLRRALATWAADVHLDAPWMPGHALVTMERWLLQEDPWPALAWAPIRFGAFSPVSAEDEIGLFPFHWSNVRELWSDAEARIRKEFDAYLGRFHARVMARSLAPGPKGKGTWVRTRLTFQPAFVEWFVKYQFEGYSVSDLAAETGKARSTISAGLGTVEMFTQVPLRPPDVGGRPRNAI
jgi:hypothetical protein